MRVIIAIGYTFSAWLACGFLVFAGYKQLTSRVGQVLVHCFGIVVCFAPVFRLYFRRPDPLGPAAAAATAFFFIVALDIFLVARFFTHGTEFFKSFWDWQLPALVLVTTIYLSGRLAR